jgi:sugar-specific transcriptional regulator TrmB
VHIALWLNEFVFILTKITTMVVNKAMKTALSKLTKLGFSEYEAKAYIALLKENPLTAYEIAKISGIPTSKVYEVIKKLENRETIQAIHGERSKVFIPLPAEEFIQGAGMDTSYTWHIKDYDGLIHKAKRMAATARHSVLLSLWPPEMKLLAESLREAEGRGIKIAVVHYGPAHVKAGQMYTHPVEDNIYSEWGVRGFTLVADSKEALNGTIVSTKTEAIWSMNEGFVIMAEGYVRHDIYQMKTVKRFSPFLKRMFGERFEKLRDVYNDAD